MRSQGDAFARPANAKSIGPCAFHLSKKGQWRPRHYAYDSAQTADGVPGTVGSWTGLVRVTVMVSSAPRRNSREGAMTWKDKLEIGLKEDAPYRKDNLPPSQVRGPELSKGPGRSPEVPLARGDIGVPSDRGTRRKPGKPSKQAL